MIDSRRILALESFTACEETACPFLNSRNICFFQRQPCIQRDLEKLIFLDESRNTSNILNSRQCSERFKTFIKNSFYCLIDEMKLEIMLFQKLEYFVVSEQSFEFIERNEWLVLEILVLESVKVERNIRHHNLIYEQRKARRIQIKESAKIIRWQLLNESFCFTCAQFDEKNITCLHLPSFAFICLSHHRSVRKAATTRLETVQSALRPTY